ncbi:hypothetical protein SMMN14_07906 [Sphaerulina musiva]
MRFFAAFLAMLGVASAIESYKSVQCGRKNQYIVNTVNRFCAKTNMVAPSTYTRNGLLSLNTYVWLGINGNCNPAQWVPSAICKSQFFDMCISGNDLGANYRRYGRNNCQVWEVSATKSQHGGGSGVQHNNGLGKQGGWKDLKKAFGIHKRDDETHESMKEVENVEGTTQD